MVYHKTTCEFPPSENRSMYYTMFPPLYTHADRGQRVIEYVTVRDMVGYDAMLTRMDSKTETLEMVCFRPTTSLNFVREYELTSLE